jgi:hypothetical protein
VDYLAALLPSAGLLVLFLLLMRSILHADRRERAATAKARAERQVAPESPDRPDSTS